MRRVAANFSSHVPCSADGSAKPQCRRWVTPAKIGHRSAPSHTAISSWTKLGCSKLEGTEVDVEQGTHRRQSQSDGVEERWAVAVVYGLQPLGFELAPQHFGQVEMGRIRRQIEQVKPSIFPDGAALLHLFGAVNAGVVHNYYGQFALFLQFELRFTRKALHVIHKEVAVDVFASGLETAVTRAREQGKTVDAGAPLSGYPDFFVLKLPAIGHVAVRGDAALIGIVEVDVLLLAQAF